MGDQGSGAAGSDPAALAAEVLPGVGGEPMPLREGLRHGGRSTIVVLGLLTCIDSFDNTALAVLAPDIQSSLGVSDAVLAVIASAFGVLFLLGAVPISSLADRFPRRTIASIAMTLWSAVVFATGFVQQAFWLFAARLGAGLGQSYSLPVNGPLLMDAYPIEARGKVFALFGAFQMSGLVAGPLYAGGVAALAGGDEGWRWVFLSVGLLTVPLALAAATIPEPRRGRHEMRAVLGTELAVDAGELPISLRVAFARLRKIRSFSSFLAGMAALGFALFSVPLFLNLFLEDRLGLDAWQRGLFGAAVILPAFGTVALAGRHSDRLFRESPSRAVAFIGGLVGAFGVLVSIGLAMPHVVLVGAFVAAGLACSRAAFAIMPGVVSTLIPYRLRSRGVALIGVYVFVFGSFLGAVLTGLLSDALGERTALTLVVLPSTLIGGALIAAGARFVRHDISLVVEELREEQAEATRIGRGDEDTPVLQVRNLDFSYGRVQVLFDVGFDVHRGEVLALLGTNGAGKSTMLRVISGLGVADRGVVRLHGRTVTYTDPEVRARRGIVQLAGGRAVFAPLRVDENLAMAGFRYPRAERAARVERVLGQLPALRNRRERAGDLSGGEQQMLALAMALVHDPEILLIDELSLGLAPVVVQELLRVVAGLREAGLTMVVVEQSLDVARAIADRAVFLEQGRIRFDGPVADLVARADLARAIYVGGEDG